MSFIITGLSGHPFSHLYGLTDDELLNQGAIRVSVDHYPSFPDRITLRDIPIGETALLLNHTYLDTQSPYKGSHAIFIWEGQWQAGVYQNVLPEVMKNRILSLRGFDSRDMLIEATLAQPGEAKEQILSLLSNDKVAFILAHNAKQGCFSCRIERE
ncbi:DUF1203 domain-containing protein [Rosenbergiella epipactidis]|uniref:DUF1203 domain-containing protein n=1 Tax=Rosenbergiella epipactidis TaxID=1544694 RepID=UPI001F4E63A6|nr:DUF1203 domain-containing protein [Rosenbergiella epipactidis]